MKACVPPRTVFAVSLPRVRAAGAARAFALILVLALFSLGDRARSQTAPPEAPSPAPAGLPDAPQPEAALALPPGVDSASSEGVDPVLADPSLAARHVQQGIRNPVPLNQCPFDRTGAPECRVHWHQLIISASLYNAFQDAGNLYTGYWYRYETMHGKWLDRYFDSVTGWRWDSWNDNNPWLDDYVGHPMMGAITSYLWIQNDPKGMTLEYSNTRPYWRSRMRALAFSTAFSLQWKFSPFGEAGIGHNGDHYFVDKGVKTNETGWVELVTTPVGGLLWTMGEDAIDKHIVHKMEMTPRRPLTLLALSFLTPSKATANILRFRPPWYRDGYQVKAHTFWSDPDGAESQPDPDTAVAYAAAAPLASGTTASGPAASGVVRPAPGLVPEWPRYGGVHEFGAWWGLSLMSGHVWGYDGDVKYMPIDVNYSYLLNPTSHRWAFRYAPEITALAMLDERAFKATNRFDQRQRAYGSGISPVGFRASFLPDARVQPYLSGNGGFIYFDQRVLSPQGSQFMYTIDYGAGLTFFRKKRQSFSIGYRYQHLSNANISHHNPGTDANTFYVAVSRFRTKGYR